jgi:flagellar basal body-associated protein FliL
MEEKKHHSKIIIILIVLTTCVLAGILAYYFFVSRDNKPAESSDRAESTETIITTSEVGTVTVPTAADPLPHPPAPTPIR